MNHVMDKMNNNNANRGRPNEPQTDMTVASIFGTAGTGVGQLDTPHGFCLGINDTVVIADTNNHRISIFTLTGQFVHSYGEKGNRDGQLYLPRKVAMMPPAILTPQDASSALHIVCDRGAKRSRMQIFTVNGRFVRDIAIPYMDIISGMTTTQDRKIIVVDSVRSGVSVLNEFGILLFWFSCSAEMLEPSDVAVHNNHYYICDFKGHRVNVFDHTGVHVRKIGENIAKFPNGIDISNDGDILVGDSHGNRLRVSLYNDQGQTLGLYDCPYQKVSRCCGLKVTSQGNLVTLAKSNNFIMVLNPVQVAGK